MLPPNDYHATRINYKSRVSDGEDEAIDVSVMLFEEEVRGDEDGSDVTEEDIILLSESLKL